MDDLRTVIDELWSRRDPLDAADPAVSGPILHAVGLLDSGAARVAEIVDDAVIVHEWLKRAILLFFATTPNVASGVGPFEIVDKVPLKTGLEAAGVRALPGSPVIIEDDAFIGSRSMVTEGARVGRGAMLGAGVILNPSIPVIDAETGEEAGRGVVPPWCLVINATRPKSYPGGTSGLLRVLIIKRFSEGSVTTKAALNDALRAHGAAL